MNHIKIVIVIHSKNDVIVEKPIYLGVVVLELNKLHRYETYYDKLKPYFGMENIQPRYMDTDSFILSVNTKDLIRDLKNSEDIFDISNLDEKREIFSNKNKKVIGKFKIETIKNIWIDEFVCLRPKTYSFKCNDNTESKNKIKGISKSQSKRTKFEEFYNCLFGEEYQKECNNYIIRSLNHEMYLQEVRKPTLSLSDDKLGYIIETECLPCN